MTTTFRNSTLDIYNFYLGWGNALVKGGNASIGAGTTLTAFKIAIGDSGADVYDNVKSVLSVDGGTVCLTGETFYVSYASPRAEFVLNDGTVTVDTAAIQMHGNTAPRRAQLQRLPPERRHVQLRRRRLHVERIRGQHGRRSHHLQGRHVQRDEELVDSAVHPALLQGRG